MGSRAQASSTPQNQRFQPPLGLGDSSSSLRQAQNSPDGGWAHTRLTLQSGFRSPTKLSSQLSVTLLSADHLFWAQASSLVIAYCHVACLCVGSASQPAQPSPSPALHGLRLTGCLGKAKLLEPGWAVSWLDSEHWEKLRDISSWGPRGRRQGWGRTKALTASE